MTNCVVEEVHEDVADPIAVPDDSGFTLDPELFGGYTQHTPGRQQELAGGNLLRAECQPIYLGPRAQNEIVHQVGGAPALRCNQLGDLADLAGIEEPNRAQFRGKSEHGRHRGADLMGDGVDQHVFGGNQFGRAKFLPGLVDQLRLVIAEYAADSNEVMPEAARRRDSAMRSESRADPGNLPIAKAKMTTPWRAAAPTK